MTNKKLGLIIFLAVIILSYVLAPYAGKLYEKIIGYNVTSWGDYDAEKYEGFVIAWAGVAGLLFFGLMDKNRLNLAVTFVLIPALLLLLARQGDAFLIALGFGLAGLGLGQLVYLTRWKMKTAAGKNKTVPGQK